MAVFGTVGRVWHNWQRVALGPRLAQWAAWGTMAAFGTIGCGWHILAAFGTLAALSTMAAFGTMAETQLWHNGRFGTMAALAL